MKTIAIIPAFNEFDRLQGVNREVLPFVDHIVVVDDGSREPLREQLDSNPAITILRHTINLGKGAALKTGVMWAIDHGYEAVVFIDADGQHDPKEIPSLLRPILEQRAEIVFGVREFHGRMPLIARAGNHLLTKAMQVLYRIQVDDSQSGFRALKISAFEKIAWQSPRYAVETEMIVNTGKHHVPFVQVPITTIYHDRYKGTTVIDGIRIMINILAWKIL
ncbi:MAG: glycosyltransferase family 2 protein [Patescibacteria group bacterium]|mgnify:CR=1 FL=1